MLVLIACSSAAQAVRLVRATGCNGFLLVSCQRALLLNRKAAAVRQAPNIIVANVRRTFGAGVRRR
jgi:hypothetical protein